MSANAIRSERPPVFPTEAPFTCEYCRHEAADCLLVFDLSGGTSDRRIKSLTCTPCGRQGIKDAGFKDFARAVNLYRLTPDAEVPS